MCHDLFELLFLLSLALSLDALQLSKGRLKFQSNLVLNNAPSDKDDLFNDPKKLNQNTQPIRKY